MGKQEQLPVITDVLKEIDWHKHITEEKKRPFVDCQDEEGRKYTVMPFYDRVYADQAPVPRKGFFLVYRLPIGAREELQDPNE